MCLSHLQRRRRPQSLEVRQPCEWVLLAGEILSRGRRQEVDRGLRLQGRAVEGLLDLGVYFLSAPLDLYIAGRGRQHLLVIELDPRQELELLHHARAWLLSVALYRVLELGLGIHSDGAAAHLVRHQYSLRLFVNRDQLGLL